MTYRAELSAAIIHLEYPYTTLNTDCLVPLPSKPEQEAGPVKEELAVAEATEAIETI